MGRFNGTPNRPARKAGSFPFDLPPYDVAGVYLLYHGGDVVYIGQSGNIRTRVLSHSMLFPIDRIQIIEIPDKRERKILERQLIDQHRPFQNRVVPFVDVPVR